MLLHVLAHLRQLAYASHHSQLFWNATALFYKSECTSPSSNRTLEKHKYKCDAGCDGEN